MLQIQNRPEMQEVTLAVLGAAGVGKSTFVQCALDIKMPAISPCTTKKVLLEGIVSVLRLLEFQPEDVGISEGCGIVWPKSVGDKAKHLIEGALVLCDIMDQSSLLKVAELLSKLEDLSHLLFTNEDKWDSISMIHSFGEYDLLFSIWKFSVGYNAHLGRIIIRCTNQYCNPDHSHFFKMR